MANLREIRTRLAAVISTRQITSAMKLVSAAKLRKAQDAIIHMRPFSHKLHEIINHCQACLYVSENQLMAERQVKRVLIIMISSNRGLCGAFNINIAKAALQIANEKFNTQFLDGKVDFLAIGKKAADYLRSKGIKMAESRNDLFNDLNFNTSTAFIEEVVEKYLNGYYDHIELVYNRFKNALIQIITTEIFLPMQRVGEIKTEPETQSEIYQEKEYIIEPSIEFILEALTKKKLKTDFYMVLIESNASEHGARMTAMHKATENANQMITELRLNYNKARQSSITNEILEIVGGAESLGK